MFSIFYCVLLVVLVLLCCVHGVCSCKAGHRPARLVLDLILEHQWGVLYFLLCVAVGAAAGYRPYFRASVRCSLFSTVCCCWCCCKLRPYFRASAICWVFSIFYCCVHTDCSFIAGRRPARLVIDLISVRCSLFYSVCCCWCCCKCFLMLLLLQCPWGPFNNCCEKRELVLLRLFTNNSRKTTHPLALFLKLQGGSKIDVKEITRWFISECQSYANIWYFEFTSLLITFLESVHIIIIS